MKRVVPLVGCLWWVACGGGGAKPPDAASAPDGGSDASVPVCSAASECDDGRFCNGEERCEPGASGANAFGCVEGDAPCMRCDEDTDTCRGCDVEPDADGDGYEDVACGGLDCDDSDRNVSPGATERCDPDGVDEDCDPATFGFRDQDMDGFADARCCNGEACGNDCDDANGNVHPTQAETCNGVDDDCDGTLDESLASSTWYPDCDGDMFGRIGEGIAACSRPPGVPAECSGSGVYVDTAGDCDDARPGVNPSAPEVCNGIDDDCSGGFEGPGEDDDDDGYADATCGGDDCRDSDPAYHPDAVEVCSSFTDRNCDGRSEDHDGDGFLVAGSTCEGGTLADAPRTDCDDDAETTNPGATDVCNGVDDDCDTRADEGASALCDVLPGASEVCTAGTCTFSACESGTRECEGGSANGCENIRFGGAHCGACGNACAFACNDGMGCDPVRQVEGDYVHMCALTMAGYVYCWGRRMGPWPEYDRPHRIDISGVAQVDVGYNHACARKTNGEVWCWGDNFDQQLGFVGDGTATPVRVSTWTDVVDVAAGFYMSCALRSGGQLCCWGDDGEDAFGDGTTDSSGPTPVCRATSYASIDLGQRYGCGLTAGGALSCWGGVGSSGSPSSFGMVSRAPSSGVFTDVSTGHLYACAVRNDAKVLCWGDNRELQTSYASSTSSVGPVEVPLTGTPVDVDAAAEHTCVRMADGTMRCWGLRAGGALGDGMTSGRTATPQTVVSLSDAGQFVAGGSLFDGNSVCVVRTGGRLSCFGDNDDGQVGSPGPDALTPRDAVTER
ncbi:MAG: hypothetical protein H6722_16270 [Sandaracinus sp.]|nr:hypothetical protein [Sandaracinus sp.]